MGKISDNGLPALLGVGCRLFALCCFSLDEEGLFVVYSLEVYLDGVGLEVLRRNVGLWEIVKLVTYAFFEDLFVLLLLLVLGGLFLLYLLLGLFFLFLRFAEMVDISLVFYSRLRLEFARLLRPTFFSFLFMLFYEALMAFLWFSWLYFFKIEWLRNCLMPVLSFPGLKKKHLVVMHLLKIGNAVTLTLQLVFFGVLHLQLFLLFSNVFIVILKILHVRRKTCTLQQLCSPSLPLSFVACSDCLRLVCSLWDRPRVEGPVPIIVIIHLFGLLVVSDRQVERLCYCFGFYC